MKRKCNIKYKDNEVILGEITFLEEENDGQFKAIIHSINTIVEGNSPEEAEEIGEANIEAGFYEAYLVPSMYKGDIEYISNK